MFGRGANRTKEKTIIPWAYFSAEGNELFIPVLVRRPISPPVVRTSALTNYSRAMPLSGCILLNFRVNPVQGRLVAHDERWSERTTNTQVTRSENKKSGLILVALSQISTNCNLLPRFIFVEKHDPPPDTGESKGESVNKTWLIA